MPLLFSYGTLQWEEVQLRTFGRRLEGRSDALAGFAPSRVPIADPEVAAAFGTTHHANVTPVADPERRVSGMVFEVAEAELAGADVYEAQYGYARIVATLVSGAEAWVYLHRAGGAP